MSNRCLGCMEIYGDEFDVCPHCGYIKGTPAEETIHMNPGTLLYDRYIIGKVLGFGGFGVTYIGWDGKLEQKVAIKEYLPSEFSTRMLGESTITIFNGEKGEQFNDGLNKFIEEAKRLAKFQNESGIVKIFDSFKENETAYIVMEFLDGETLAEKLKREHTIDEDEAVKMLIPIMNSLQTVHEEGILHRDISPDNIFLTKDGEVKLIDFGASRFATTSHSRSLTVIIKQGYSPEEQYRSRGDQGPHTDVYSLAATLYKMITGKTPPDAMERRAKYENKKKEILEEPHKLNKKISINRENAILNAMNIRIEDRTPDMASFLSELEADPPVKRRYGKIKKIDLYSWPLWLKILLTVLMVVALTFGALLATGVIDFPSLFSDEVIVPEGVVVVPNVEGLDKDEAIKIIQESNLVPSAEGNVVSEYVKTGKIVLQNPLNGMYLDEGGKVILTVSSGKGVVSAENGVSTVPYVVWDTQETAIEKLKTAGLAEPIIEQANDETVPAGQVISQSLEADEKVKEGTQITIVISLGPPAFEMPNEVGKTEATAKAELDKVGLKVAVQYQNNENVPAGQVLSQSVGPNQMVTKGTEIVLVVSTGPSKFSMPNVVNATESDAKSTLTSRGLQVAVQYKNDDTYAEGRVISQSIGAGTSVSRGTEVIITVSSGKQLFAIPNVVGMTKSDATSTLKKPGFVVAETSEYSSTVANGKVIKQSHKANSTAPKGTVITITVSKGQQPVAVNFNANGGNVSTSSKVTYLSSTYGTLPTPTRTYYTFDGWYTSASGGTRITSSTTVSNASTHTLYAHWTQNQYTGWITDTSLLNNSAYKAESKMQYQYRDKSVTTSQESSLSGWIQSGSSVSYGAWGSWSDWQEGQMSANEVTDVETATVYGYYYFYCTACGTHMHGWGTNACYTWAGGCGNSILSSNFAIKWSNLTWTQAGHIDWYGTGKHATTSLGDGQRWFEWTNDGQPRAGYRYRTRPQITTYTYYKWSSWSSWSDTPCTSSASREVNTRTLYRYIKK